MADDKNKREGVYKRELQSRKDVAREKSEIESKPDETPEEKESLFRKMGKGKLGRYGKAVIAAGTLAGAQPGGAQMSDDDQIADEMRKNQQQETTQQYEEPRQNQVERMFGEGVKMSEQTKPYNAANFGDINKKEDQQPLGEDLDRKPSAQIPEDEGYASRIPTPGGGRAPGELAQAKELDPDDERRLNEKPNTLDQTSLGQQDYQDLNGQSKINQEQQDIKFQTPEYLDRKPSAQIPEDEGYASRIPTPGGGRAPGELAQPKQLDPELEVNMRDKPEMRELENYTQNQQRDNTNQTQTDKTDKALSVAKGAASVAQAGGKGAEFAGKGTQIAGKGMEAGGKAIQKGGQAMTKAGAELSSTGLGAVVGVPLAATGVVTSVAGAGVQATGKGAQTAGKGIEKGGKVVAQGSKRVKSAIDKAKEIKQSGGMQKGDAPGEQYMNLARQFKEAKKKAQEGDVAGIVKDGVDTVSQLATARALSWAWYALIPTFGLSILYINFHFVAHYFAHSTKFCGFGEEWMIQKMSKKGGAMGAIKETETMLEIVEVGGMVVVNVLLVVFLAVAMTLGYFIMNPIEGFNLLVS